MKKQLIAAAIALGTSLMSVAQAGLVNVWGESFPLSTLNNFYNTIGHTSSIVGGDLDTVNLTGVNLLWAVQPSNDYTAAELAAMATYLSKGGRIAFMGEHGSYMPAENNRINAALTYLGASIQTVNNAVSCGFQTAARVNGEIATHALTTGVDTYQYACFSELTISGTAQALMYGKGGPNSVMMAYQNIGAGSVFFITDQNVWDGAGSMWPGYNNARMFENLVTASTGAPPVGVPEPGSVALLGLGLVAAGVLRRRKAQ